MLEKFDLNKKSVPGEGYRKNLAEELKSLPTEEAQEKLLAEQNNKRGNYRDEKIEQRALWIVQKYFSEPDMFKMNDDLSLDQRDEKIKEIFNQKIKELDDEKKGVVDELKYEIYALARRIIEERDIENNPNFEHVKGKYLDLVLEIETKTGKDRNKFLEIEIRDNNLDRNIFNDLLVDMQSIQGNSPKEARYYKEEENEGKILPDLREFMLNKLKDEKDQFKFVLDSIFRSKSETIIIARPMKIFYEHSLIIDEFMRDHKNYQEDDYSSRRREYTQKDTSMLFGEDNKQKLENFTNAVLEIIKNETDYKTALEKIKKIPKPTGIHPTFSVRGGGYIYENDKGVFCPGRTSEVYGLFDKGLVDYAFQKNFDKKYNDEEIELHFW